MYLIPVYSAGPGVAGYTQKCMQHGEMSDFAPMKIWDLAVKSIVKLYNTIKRKGMDYESFMVGK